MCVPMRSEFGRTTRCSTVEPSPAVKVNSGTFGCLCVAMRCVQMPKNSTVIVAIDSSSIDAVRRHGQRPPGTAAGVFIFELRAPHGLGGLDAGGEMAVHLTEKLAGVAIGGGDERGDDVVRAGGGEAVAEAEGGAAALRRIAQRLARRQRHHA